MVFELSQGPDQACGGRRGEIEGLWLEGGGGSGQPGRGRGVEAARESRQDVDEGLSGQAAQVGLRTEDGGERRGGALWTLGERRVCA